MKLGNRPATRVWSLVAGAACVALLAAACSSGGSSDSSSTTGDTDGADSGSLSVRKDVKDMSDVEKQEYVDAILTLKETPSTVTAGSNLYDDFVATHLEANSCARRWDNAGAAHHSPTFLPWHREWIMKYEAALRTASGDPDLALPYWDWTDSESTDAVFSADFFGPTGDAAEDYAVIEGPFAKGKWEVAVTDPIEVQKAILGSDDIVAQPAWLVRNIGAANGNTSSPPTDEDVDTTLRVETYDVAPFSAQSAAAESFRGSLEGFRSAKAPECVVTPDNPDGYFVTKQADGVSSAMHNGVHGYVGGRWKTADGAQATGSMIPYTSPNDPVFFLHHANVDRVWAEWQREHPDLAHYLPQSGGAEGWNGPDTMWPWNDVTINSLLDIDENGYTYASLSTG